MNTSTLVSSRIPRRFIITIAIASLALAFGSFSLRAAEPTLQLKDNDV